MQRRIPVGVAAISFLVACAPPQTPGTSAPAPSLARTSPPIVTPPAPSPAEDLDLADRMIEKALHTSPGAERQASFGIALLALERATGSAPRAIALSGRTLHLLDESTLVAQALSEPDGRAHAVAIKLDPPGGDGGQPRGRPFRLLGGGEQPPAISVGKSGGVVVNHRGTVRAYATVASEAHEIPGGLRFDVARDAVVIGDERHVKIVKASNGEVVLADTAVKLGRLVLDAVTRTEDERFWIACKAVSADASGVVVVDLETKRVTVNLPHAAGCFVDAERSRIVVLQPPDAMTATPYVELVPLDGSASARIALPKAKALGSPTLSADTEHRGLLVGFGAPSFLDLETKQLFARMPIAPRVGPAALKNVPVGHAGDSASAVAPLASLAKLPRTVIVPKFFNPHVWTQNGLLSFDEKTAVAFTAGPDGEAEESPIQMVIADAVTLAVRHRIDVHLGPNWLTAYFLDDRFLVAQSLPQFNLYDSITGTLVATPSLEECPDARPRLGHYFLCDRALWWIAQDPAKQVKDQRIDLGLGARADWTGKAPLRELGPRRGEKGTIRFTAGGKVALRDMVAPSWLHCRFGDRLAPFEVCQSRLLEGAGEPAP